MSRASRGEAAATRRDRRSAERSSHRARHRERPSIWRGPLPYVAAIVVIVGVVAWSLLSSRGGPAPTLAPTASDAVLAGVTSIPADVYDTVGSGGIADPLRPTTFEMLRGPSGSPLVIYVGAEYCPFCASEKWSVVAALSRFGTFEGLSLSSSSSTDVFPDTPTITFRGASYRSTFIELSAIEASDRQGRPIASKTAVQQASMERSDPQGSIPFVSIADRHVAVGSGYRPDVLKGKTWTQIAEAMRDPSTPVARGIIGNANWLTAAICTQTGGQPAAVCGSPAVRGLPAR